MSEVTIKSEETGPLSTEDEALLKQGEEETPADDQGEEQEQPKEGEDQEKSDAEKEAEKALNIAGLDMSTFENEFQEKGELSEESFEKLEMAGFPRQVVENYINGLRYTQESNNQEEKLVTQIHETVGGEKAYKQMISWADANLSSKEIDSFNRIVATKEPDTIKWAISALQSRYQKSVGSTPNYIQSDAPASKEQGFKSTQEVVAAMKDKRYGVDPAYTKEVEKKMSVSNVF